MFANGRKFLGEPLHDERGLGKTWVESGELVGRNVINVVIRFEIVKIAMPVALGHAREREGALGLVSLSAIARDRPDKFWFSLRCRAGFIRGKRLRALRFPLYNFPAAALALRTIWLRHARRISAAGLERKRTSLCKARGPVETNELDSNDYCLKKFSNWWPR